MFFEKIFDKNAKGDSFSHFYNKAGIRKLLLHGLQVVFREVGCVAHFPVPAQSFVLVCTCAVEGQQVHFTDLRYVGKQGDNLVDVVFAVVDMWNDGYACHDVAAIRGNAVQVVDDGGVGSADISFENLLFGGLYVEEEYVGVLADVVE